MVRQKLEALKLHTKKTGNIQESKRINVKKKHL